MSERALSAGSRAALARPLFGYRDDDALVLAHLVSTAPLIPWSLVRAVRRGLLPDVGASVEARLAASLLVQARGVDGWTLEPQVANRCRARLAFALRDEPADAERLRAILLAGVQALSPLLAIEERLAWACVIEDDPAPTIERLLRDVVLTIAHERRTRAMVWASGALQRLPDDVRRTGSAWVLGQMCRAAGVPCPEISIPAAGVDPALLREIRDQLPTRYIGLHRRRDHLEVGWLSKDRRVAIPVLDVEPRTLVVESAMGGAEINVASYPQRIEVGRGPVVIIDRAGRRFELRPSTEDEWPEGRDAEAALDVVEGWMADQREVPATVVGYTPRTRRWADGGVYVAFDELPGVAAFMAAPHAMFNPARLRDLMHQQIRVQVTLVNRDSGGVSVVRVREPMDVGPLEVDQERMAVVTRVEEYGVFMRLEPLPGEDFGDAPPVGLLHVKEMDSKWVTQQRHGVRLGERFEVTVMALNPALHHISLTRKPQAELAARATIDAMKIGDYVDGEVVNSVDYGHFIRVGEVQGLLHISEIPEGVTLARGQRLRLRVVTVELARLRFSLSLRDP